MLACARALVAEHGVRRGLFRGWGAVVLRDAPTFGVYFVAYEASRRAGTPADGSHTPTWVMLAGGALAGASSWLLATPADVIKSIIQGSPVTTPRAELRIAAVARRVYAAEGLAGFFRGVVPSVVRSLPVNAVTFWGYELSCRALQPVFGADVALQ
jgi:hypothetical protein